MVVFWLVSVTLASKKHAEKIIEKWEVPYLKITWYQLHNFSSSDMGRVNVGFKNPKSTLK